MYTKQQIKNKSQKWAYNGGSIGEQGKPKWRRGAKQLGYEKRDEFLRWG